MGSFSLLGPRRFLTACDKSIIAGLRLKVGAAFYKAEIHSGQVGPLQGLLLLCLLLLACEWWWLLG